MTAATSTSYITRQGDMLDLVCRRRYGNEHGTVETVLAANPHLADLGPALPAGIVILLPDMPKPAAARKASINLWD